jgi:hypothetical protein
MLGPVNGDRRRFLRTAAMAIAAAQATILGEAEAKGVPKELAALGRASGWINSSGLTPESLAGKVVLVQFCTYTCINWLRTLPQVRAWARTYREGLVVVGVHTPEFAFEHVPDNVRRAVQQLRLEWPIAIDNDYAIWRAFNNQYWPALYFIDDRGRVRDHQFGEGEYDRSKQIIERLLGAARLSFAHDIDARVEATALEAPADWNNLKSPENYLGYERTQNFAASPGTERDRPRAYTAPARLALNQWALGGEWRLEKTAAILATAGGRIVYRFHARDLHLVMGPPRPGSSVRFRTTIDGLRPGPSHGADTDVDGNGVVAEQRLYQLIRQSGPITDRRFEIEFFEPGVEAFSFTFG